MTTFTGLPSYTVKKRIKCFYLQCILFVEVSCKDSERNVDDYKGEDCRPNGDVLNQLFSEVVEHSGKVDSVDGSNKPGSETSHQVTSKPRALRCCQFRLIYETVRY